MSINKETQNLKMIYEILMGHKIMADVFNVLLTTKFIGLLNQTPL